MLPLRSSPMPQGVQKPFTQTDAILSKDTFNQLEKQLEHDETQQNTNPKTRKELLASYGDQLSSSYEGYPDMIRAMLSFLDKSSINVGLLLEKAAIQSIEEKKQDILKGFEKYVINNERFDYISMFQEPLSSQTPSLWKTDLLSYKQHYPNSVLSFHINKLDTYMKLCALDDNRNSVDDEVEKLRQDISNSATFTQFVYDLFHDTFCVEHTPKVTEDDDLQYNDGSSTNHSNIDLMSAKVLQLRQKLNLIATYDEVLATYSFYILTYMSKNSDNKFVKDVVKQLILDIRLESLKCAKIGISGNMNEKNKQLQHSSQQTTGMSLASIEKDDRISRSSKKYAVLLSCMVEAITTGEKQKNTKVINFIVSLLNLNSIGDASGASGSSGTTNNASSKLTNSLSSKKKMDKTFNDINVLLNSIFGKLDLDVSNLKAQDDSASKAIDDLLDGTSATGRDGGRYSDDDSGESDEVIDLYALDDDDDSSVIANLHAVNDDEKDIIETTSRPDISTNMKLLFIRWLNYPEIHGQVLYAMFTGSVEPTAPAASPGSVAMTGSGTGATTSATGAMHHHHHIAAHNQEKIALDERRQRCLAAVLAVDAVCARLTDNELRTRFGKKDLRRAVVRRYRHIRRCADACMRIRSSTPAHALSSPLAVSAISSIVLAIMQLPLSLPVALQGDDAGTAGIQFGIMSGNGGSSEVNKRLNELILKLIIHVNVLNQHHQQQNQQPTHNYSATPHSLHQQQQQSTTLRMHEETLGALVGAISGDELSCQGTLLWLIDGLIRSEANVRVLSNNFSKYIGLLEVVVRAHPRKVFDVIKVMRILFFLVTTATAASNRGYSSQMKDDIVRALASWTTIGSGFVGRAILYIFLNDWIMFSTASVAKSTQGYDDAVNFKLHKNGGVEKNLVKTFVLRLLQSIEPPFAPGFASVLMSFLANPKVDAAVSEDVNLASMVLELRKQIHSSNV